MRRDFIKVIPHPLDSVAVVRRLVDFYVRQHNSVLPHSALGGQTPDEMCFGTGKQVPDELAARRREARRRRLRANRSVLCDTGAAGEAAA